MELRENGVSVSSGKSSGKECRRVSSKFLLHLIQFELLRMPHLHTFMPQMTIFCTTLNWNETNRDSLVASLHKFIPLYTISLSMSTYFAKRITRKDHEIIKVTYLL